MNCDVGEAKEGSSLDANGSGEITQNGFSMYSTEKTKINK